MICKEGPQTVKCIVLEKVKGTYSSLVIQNLETYEYVILTIFPNWEGEIPERDDCGYIEFEYTKAGVTKYYDKAAKAHDVYKNDYFVFRKFVRETTRNTEDILI